MEVKLGAVPFQEAISFFQAKGLVPTQQWGDLIHEGHQTGFMVAGVTNMQLLADLHNSLLDQQKQGVDFGTWRKQFDQIIAQHGWVPDQSPAWRARVIWQANMRTSAAVGRWQQAQRLKDRRPYLRYSAVMDSRTRPLHRQWHGTILLVDHVWWDTHFPPNGWGCRCTTQSLSAANLTAAGWKVTQMPPRGPLRAVQVPGQGMLQVPEGIDAGWAYNPGKGATVRQAMMLAQRAIAKAPPELAAAARQLISKPPASREVPRQLPSFENWAAPIVETRRPDNSFHRLGELSAEVVGKLEAGIPEERVPGRAVGDPGVYLTARVLAHLARDTKADAGRAIAVEDIMRLPELVQHPEAVVLDRKSGAVLLVFTPIDAAEGRLGKLVVLLDRMTKMSDGTDRERRPVASVRTAGLVPAVTLQDANAYVVLSGSVG